MKKTLVLILSAALLLLCACGAPGLPEPPEASSVPEPHEDPVPSEEIPVPTPEPTPVTVPGVTACYSAGGYSIAEITGFFRENALPSEDSALMRWAGPIRCSMGGSCAQEDLDALNAALDVLKAEDNLPELSLAEDGQGNLTFLCCTREELLEKAGEASGYEEADSAVILTCSEDDGSVIKGEILLRTDVPQSTRSVLIAKELLRALGLPGETALRSGSLLYSGYLAASRPDTTDMLVLRLLYDSHLKSGMTFEDCVPYLNSLIIE